MATTSSGLAASLGRADGSVTLDELASHVARLVAAVSVPVHLDAERCSGADAAGLAAAVDRLASAGACGILIEDWDPVRADVDPIGVATERVAAAAQAAHAHGVWLTAQADLGFHRTIDEALVDEVETRLACFVDAGADCLYAPGLVEASHLTRIVALGRPVNALIRPRGPSVPELAAVGVRRVSTGGLLAWTAYGALRDAARELSTAGTVHFAADALSPTEREVSG